LNAVICDFGLARVQDTKVFFYSSLFTFQFAFYFYFYFYFYFILFYFIFES